MEVVNSLTMGRAAPAPNRSCRSEDRDEKRFKDAIINPRKTDEGELRRMRVADLEPHVDDPKLGKSGRAAFLASAVLAR